MIRLFLTIAICLAISLTSFSSVHADVVNFNLLDQAGTTGEALEDFGTYTDPVSGITINVSAVSTLGAGTAEFQANGSGAGANSAGINAPDDEPSQLEAGESLTFEFVFSYPSIQLLSVDFGGVGGNDGMGNSAGDAALVNAAGNPFSLYTGQPNFNGSSDLWTPGGIEFNSGDTLIVNAEQRILMQNVSFNFSSIPEPSSFLVLLGAGLLGFRRRRWV